VEQSKIIEMARSFYIDLFTIEPQADLNRVLEAIPSRIDQTTNEA
jgi:hypothetical protein